MVRIAKCIIAAALTFGMAGLAQAQMQWNGSYIGGSLGYAWGSSDVTTSVNFSPPGYFAASSTPAVSSAGTGTLKPTNAFGAFTAGHNWQSAQTVFGIEGDIGNLRANATRSNGAVYPCCAPTAFNLTQSVSTTYVATLRGRLGYAQDNWLFFGTAGAAFTTLRFNQTFGDNFAAANETGSQSRSKVGWVLGAGVEYALPGRWTIKGEYQHMDFGGTSGTGGTLTAFTPAIAFPTNVFSSTANLKVDLIRIGFNYRF